MHEQCDKGIKAMSSSVHRLSDSTTELSRLPGYDLFQSVSMATKYLHTIPVQYYVHKVHDLYLFKNVVA